MPSRIKRLAVEVKFCQPPREAARAAELSTVGPAPGGVGGGGESGPALSSRPVPRPLRRCWNSERKPEPEAGGPGQEKEDTEFSGKAFGRNPREPRPTQAKLSSVFKKKSRLLTFKFVMV